MQKTGIVIEDLKRRGIICKYFCDKFKVNVEIIIILSNIFWLFPDMCPNKFVIDFFRSIDIAELV